MVDKVNLATIATFTNDTTAVTQTNNNSALITTAFDNTLSRDGTQPNSMSADLDMNSFRILNLLPPISLSEPITLSLLNAALIGAGNVPAGGLVNQVLMKNSSINFDASWQYITGGPPAGALTGTETVFGDQNNNNVSITTQAIANLATTGVTLSSLPAASSLNASDLFYVVQGGVDKQAAASLLDAIALGAITVGTTPIGGGTNTRILFDNAGFLGENVGLTWGSNFLNVGPGGAGAGIQIYGSSGTLGGSRSAIVFDNGTPQFNVGFNGTYGIGPGDAGGSTDTVLTRNSAGIFAMVNTVQPHGLRIYNTSDVNGGTPTNYERGVMDWTTTTNVFTIGTQAGGSGTVRNIQFAAGTTKWADYGISIASQFNVTIPMSGGGINLLTGSSSSFGAVSIWDVANTNRPIFIGATGGGFYGISCANDGRIGFSNISSTGGDSAGAADTAISRASAGVIALGNGTVGDSSATIKAKTKAGVPTTSDVAAGSWVLIRDTTNSTTKLYYNNAGTLQSVALV